MQTTSPTPPSNDWSVRSVLGDVPIAGIGATACHEHLLIRDSRPTQLEPDYLLDDIDAAVQECLEFGAAGGATIVDCMPMGVGRDPAGLVEIAQRSGLNIVAVSGFHKDRFYAHDHWVRHLDPAAITTRVVDDITIGMEQAADTIDVRERSTATPGLIKVATSGAQGTPLEEKLLDAVGAAATTTELPVITHTESITGAQHQVARLAAIGVEPDRVVLSHMDRHGTVEEVAELCAAGATVCFDWLGRLDRRPDQVVVDLVTDLIDRGHLSRIVLGQDLARRQYWRTFGGGPGLRHLFHTVVPQLHQAGVSSDDVNQILVETPRRILARRPSQPEA